MSVDKVLAHLAATEADAIARLCDWLRIPSVSTDPAGCHGHSFGWP